MKRPWLAPLVPLYAAGHAWRDIRLKRGWERTRRLRWPVLSVGNLSTGGVGKTPFVIALARLLSTRGFEVDVLSRGYGRHGHAPARVRLGGTAEEFGDEPLLIAQEAGVPVYVAPQRYDAGFMAEAHHSDDYAQGLHLLDDGFQHRGLARDIDILLLNLQDWEDSLLPAGNLREPLSAIRRASVVAIPTNEPELENKLKTWGWQGPVWRFHRRMDTPPVTGPVVAFCGIARPEQFFAGLKSAGLSVADQVAFPDHHCYTARDIKQLLSSARKAGAKALMTTQKDQTRLGRLAALIPRELPLKCAHLRIQIDEEAAALEWLQTRLAGSRVPASL